MDLNMKSLMSIKFSEAKEKKALAIIIYLMIILSDQK